MTDHPILFSGPMVRAILEGRKTQTRRVLKPQPKDGSQVALFYPNLKVVRFSHDHKAFLQDVKTKYAIGDRLWVREGWTTRQELDAVKPSEISQNQSIGYIADDEGPWLGKRRPSIFMPRWASRLTLTVTDVRVQRLQDISEEDAIAEGVELDLECCGNFDTGFDLSDHGEPINLRQGDCCGNPALVTDPRLTFGILWDSINGKRAPWESNPWVAAYTFTFEERNIGQ